MNKRYKTFPRLLASSALFGLLTACLFGGTIFAQAGSAGQSGILQEKLAAIKASTAENQKKLHQYSWTQTSQITLNGSAKPAKEFTCTYGPNGKVQKVPIGGAVDTTSNANARGGRFRQRIVEKKTTEMKDYMTQVGGVIELYMPPDPAKMQQAFQQHKVSFTRDAGIVNLTFKDYALPGDSMTISFDTTAKKIRTLNVKSYLDNPQDGVTLLVNFASLPDGTNYPQRTALNAQAKNMQVVNTNSNYRKLSQ